MEEGAKVGVLARLYVPGGRLIKRGGRSVNAILDESKAALADPSVPAIYECAVIADNTLVFADILERVDGGFVLIEVKSKTSVSEQKHIPDVAIQAHALRAAGVTIVRCEIMHLNRDCVYPDLSNLFAREDVTDLVEARADFLLDLAPYFQHLELLAQQLGEPLEAAVHVGDGEQLRLGGERELQVGGDEVGELPRVGDAAEYLVQLFP